MPNGNKGQAQTKNEQKIAAQEEAAKLAAAAAAKAQAELDAKKAAAQAEVDAENKAAAEKAEAEKAAAEAEKAAAEKAAAEAEAKKVTPEQQAELDKLTAALDVAKLANKTALIEDKPDEEIQAAEQAVSDAREAIKKFWSDLAIWKAEQKELIKLNAAKADLCEKFGIAPEKLEELITAAKAAPAPDVKPDTLKSSFVLVFGQLPRFVEQGATGKSLTSGSKKAPVSSNGSAEKGAKSAAIEADLASGMTYAQLLLKYPTYQKETDSYDYTKLNGTARTVISNGNWVKQADGTYAK